MVAAYWFRFAKTGASASRECSSCEGFGSLAFHVHDKVRVWSKERHLAFRIATIGTVRVGFDQLSNSEAIRGFAGGDGSVLAHELVSLFNLFTHRKSGHSRTARGSRNASIPYLSNSRSTSEYLNPPQGASRSSSIPFESLTGSIFICGPV